MLKLRGVRGSGGGRRQNALAVLLLAAFLLSLQDTAASVALPTIGRDLGLGAGGLEWVVNAYTVALAVLVLPAGRLADRVGRRRLFVIGLVVFGVASLAAGLSSSAVALLVARVVQGAGAGLMGPASLALIAAAGGKRQASAIGAWAGASAAGLALGPLVGAVLTEQLGWSWIFLIDVPLVVVALAVVPGAIARDEPGGRDRRPLDVGGIVLSGLALAAGIVTTFRMIGLAVGISGMGALVALRWPGGLAAAGLPSTGLGDGLADAFTVNAVLALATAALAYFTLGQARTGSSTADKLERPGTRAADAPHRQGRFIHQLQEDFHETPTDRHLSRRAPRSRRR